MNVRIRRYAEATNYAKVLTGIYNGIPKGENGMIIKYQNPPHGIARRDAIKDYRPDIPNRIRRATPAEHIQSMIDIYGQSEQPTVTSDVKSPWQHQQAQEAASKGYDDYMQAKKYEEGLHNLNGILTFTDYATLATGLGSLLSKGASMAGRYAGKQMAKRAVGKEFKRQSKHLATPANNSLLVDMSGVTPRPLSEFSSLSDAELAKLLPDYAHPNWQGGARIYTFLATSVPDSLTYYTPGMFTPSAVIQGFHSSPRSVVYSTISNYTYVSANPTGTKWTAATTRPQLTGLTKGLYVNEAGTNTFMLIGNNMKSVSTDRGNNWTTSTLGEYTLTDLIYVDSNWYAIGSNGTKRFLLQNTASTFDQSNKILDLPDYSRQVIKINT